MLGTDVRAVFFDAVGTLLFPVTPISHTYRTMAAKHGIDLHEDDMRKRLREGYVRQEKHDSLAEWRTDEQREEARWRAVVSEVLQCEGAACFRDLWNHYSTPQAWQVHPEASEV